MKSKFTKLLATALVLCLVLALLPAAAFAAGDLKVTFSSLGSDVDNGGEYALATMTATGASNVNGQFDNGEQVTLSFSAKQNERIGIAALIVNGTTVDIKSDPEHFVYTFPITQNTTVQAEFRRYFDVEASCDTQGAVTFVGLQGPYMRGMPVTFQISLNGAYATTHEIQSVTYETGSQDGALLRADASGNYTFDMPAGKTFVNVTLAERSTYNITIEKTGEGTVSTTPSGSAYANQTVAVNAIAAEGASVKSVVIYKTDDPSTKVTYDTTAKSFVMPNYPVTVSVEFGPFTPPVTDTYTIITADKITGGKILSTVNSAEAGDTVYIKVDPDLYYKTKCVYYTTSEGAGIIVPWKQYLTHEYWLDTQSYEVWSFVMPDHDVYVYADFTYYDDYGTYYIDTSYDSTLGGVEVWVNNNYVGNNWHQGSWADYQDSVSFKVKPYYSDDVVSVSVVGKRTGWTYSYDYNSYSGWYTFTMPNEDVTINVDFRSGVHKVYVDKVTDGKLTVSDDWAKYGQIVYITAVPDYGCTLSSLSVRTATGDSVHVYNAQKADTYYFYMPDQYVSVSAVFTGKYTSVPFNDVSYGDWYYDAVQFVYSKGIMDGVDYYKFAPNGTITRGMIVTMLWRMAGEPFEMPVTSFTDVEIGRYYTTAVAWACRNGIADGMGESTFGPNDAITREELVTLLYRYAQYFGHSCIGTSIEGFADAGSVSSYAYNAMCWAYKAGVVTGTTGSRLNPQGTASRAEAAQMIMSFYSFLNS